MSEQEKSTQDILKNPKGMRDFFGDDFTEKQSFFDTAYTLAQYAGFKGIETPILEHTEVFTKGVGNITDIVEKEMYTLTTKGGDYLALRPEGTAGVMRSYIENGMGSLPQPVMLSYGGPFFRHEKPQKGRYRQFYQFGLEIIGSPDAMHDGYIIHIGVRILEKYTKQKIVVRLNTLGNPSVRKKYLDTLTQFYTEHFDAISTKDQSRLQTNPLRILDSKEPETVTVNQNVPKITEILDTESRHHFDVVCNYLDSVGASYKLDHTLVRGLDYYSHTVFEYIVYDENQSASLALGGGGRYDGLAETMGHNKHVPAVGLALGVDRVIEIKQSQPIDYSRTVALVELDDTARQHSYKLTDILMEHTIPIARLSNKKKLGEHLGIAESLGITTVCILGNNEVSNGTVTIRNMNTREQITVPYSEIMNHINF